MIFPEEITVEQFSDLKNYTTKISPDKTMGEIMGILSEYCDKIAQKKDGEKRQVLFSYRGEEYFINIPVVYERNENGENEKNLKIGPRNVKYFLEIYLSWADAGMIDLEQALLSNRIVSVNGQDVPLGEVAKQAQSGSLVGELDPSVKKIRPQENEKTIDVEGSSNE